MEATVPVTAQGFLRLRGTHAELANLLDLVSSVVTADQTRGSRQAVRLTLLKRAREARRAARETRSKGTNVSAPTYPVQVGGDLQPELSRGLWLVKWILAIPHVVCLVFLARAEQRVVLENARRPS